MRKHLVFSDLDGTLLNHNDYSFQDAKEAIDHLKDSNIPLILTTSKTFSEVLQLQKEMRLEAPFIVENGGGIFIPPNHPLNGSNQTGNGWLKISSASSYMQLRDFLNKMKKRYLVHGFGDMKHDEVMSLTHLDKISAHNAMQRHFTEPFIIKDATLIPKLRLEAQKAGFDIVKGGRFFHLISKDQNKAVAMQKLSKIYRSHYNKPIKTVALGDSQNDIKMIQQADIGVVMPHHDGSALDIKKNKKVLFAKYPGAKGWNQAIKDIFHVK